MARKPPSTASFATSIDAMAVGARLAFVDANIYVTAGAIGLATMLMVTLGHGVGQIAGKRAEMVGALVLTGIGTTILLEHLQVLD